MWEGFISVSFAGEQAGRLPAWLRMKRTMYMQPFAGPLRCHVDRAKMSFRCQAATQALSRLRPQLKETYSRRVVGWRLSRTRSSPSAHGFSIPGDRGRGSRGAHVRAGSTGFRIVAGVLAPGRPPSGMTMAAGCGENRIALSSARSGSGFRWFGRRACGSTDPATRQPGTFAAGSSTTHASGASPT